jgi:hypothetical protein
MEEVGWLQQGDEFQKQGGVRATEIIRGKEADDFAAGNHIDQAIGPLHEIRQMVKVAEDFCRHSLVWETHDRHHLALVCQHAGFQGSMTAPYGMLELPYRIV